MDPDFKRIRVRPISGALGAEIDGADLGQPLDDHTFGEVRRAFLDHLVIFFRDQRLESGHLKAFARRFGPLNVHPFVLAAGAANADPEVLEVVREPSSRYVFGAGWHADHTFRETPLLGAALYALEVPEAGGDTLFANMYQAYESLSEGLKALLARLRAVHRANVVAYRDDPNLKASASEMAERVAEHPVVRTHPATGRKLLFVNPMSTVRFAGMTEEESRPLLSFLFEHATRPEFTCRFRWRAGSLALWDNRCVQHNPIDDTFGHRRRMLRVAIEGDRPI